MINLLLCFCLTVGRISFRESMNQSISTFKRCKIRNHSIPVMFRQSCSVLLAVLDKFTGKLHHLKALLNTTNIGFYFCYLFRQNINKLLLCILSLRVKRNTLHEHWILFTMIVSRQSHDTTFINTHWISMKMLYKLLLNGTKQLHFRILHKPISM